MLFLKNLTARSYWADFRAVAPIVLHFSACSLFTSMVMMRLSLLLICWVAEGSKCI